MEPGKLWSNPRLLWFFRFYVKKGICIYEKGIFLEEKEYEDHIGHISAFDAFVRGSDPASKSGICI